MYFKVKLVIWHNKVHLSVLRKIVMKVSLCQLSGILFQKCYYLQVQFLNIYF